MLGNIFGGFTKNIERSLKNNSDYFAKTNRKELSKLFDNKIFPLANRLDYITRQRVDQALDGLEKLEYKTVSDIEALLNKADNKLNTNINQINDIRLDTIKDLQSLLETADSFAENRINQISLTIMQGIYLIESITSNAFAEVSNLEDKVVYDINQIINQLDNKFNILEKKIFKDADYLVDKLIRSMDEVIEGNIELVRSELKRNLLHVLPNPFDKCRQLLKLGMKPGAALSDIELYELSECYSYSKLNENVSVDEILKIYGQLQLNAARMAALVRNAPELKRRAIEDWMEYGLLCDFWRRTVENYSSDTPFELPQTNKDLLTSI